MKTTVGDIDLELWTKEAPKACRNFIQLCMEGYYNDTIFHRIVKGFIAQGGDPTGTGEGGESIYGYPFKVQLIFIVLACYILLYFHILSFSLIIIFVLLYRMNFIQDYVFVGEACLLWPMLEKMIMALNFFLLLVQRQSYKISILSLEKLLGKLFIICLNWKMYL